MDIESGIVGASVEGRPLECKGLSNVGWFIERRWKTSPMHHEIDNDNELESHKRLSNKK